MLISMRVVWLFLLLPAFASAAVVDLAGDWHFGFDLPAGPEQPSFDDGSWRQVHVPHNHREVSEQSPKAGRAIWFRRRFDAPGVRAGQRVILQVVNGAAAAAWLNGKLVGRCNPSS